MFCVANMADTISFSSEFASVSTEFDISSNVVACQEENTRKRYGVIYLSENLRMK